MRHLLPCLAAGLLAACATTPAPVVADASPPRAPLNVLWLTAEDLSPRLGCYGDDTVPTPNLDRLAAESVRFTNAFTATGVCSPCRYTILTGLFPVQGGAQYMRTWKRTSAINQIEGEARREEARTRPLFEATPPVGVRGFPEYLREAGYWCTNNSKEDYQLRPPVTLWDASSNKAHYRDRAPGQPFFAVFNKTVTHESGIFGNGRSPQVVDPADVPVPRFLPDTPLVRRDIARHYDNVAALDAWVGQQLDALEEADLADSTVVFFYTDHGDGLPRHKRWVYDSGTRVPLLVRFPDGAGAGTTDEGLVSFVDLAPTALALAGIEAPAYMEGRVFVGESAAPPPEHVFMHRDRMDDVNHETIRSARGAEYRYVRNYRPEQPYLEKLAYRDRAGVMQEVWRALEAGELGPAHWQWTARTKPVEELYHPATDPDEVVNLAGDPAHAHALPGLRAALDDWIARTDDPLATHEDEVLRERIWPPDGTQPETAAPTVDATGLGDGRVRVVLACATEGAGVGYRTSDDGPWSIYTGPFETDAASVVVEAHRLGWKPTRVEVELAGD